MKNKLFVSIIGILMFSFASVGALDPGAPCSDTEISAVDQSLVLIVAEAAIFDTTPIKCVYSAATLVGPLKSEYGAIEVLERPPDFTTLQSINSEGFKATQFYAFNGNPRKARDGLTQKSNLTGHKS